MFHQQKPKIDQELPQSEPRRDQQGFNMPSNLDFLDAFQSGPSASPTSGFESYGDAFGGETFGGGSGGGGGGMSNVAGGATPLLWAYMIGKGKMIESKNPDTPVGNGMLAGLGPSLAQIKEDPKGMGIPTAIGLPFLTPFTGSKKAKSTKPEWAGLWEGFGL